jgi:2-hydroxy fatty acid dioxygenase
MDPLTKYKQYHKNDTNIQIHVVCIPLLLLSGYAIFHALAFYVNLFYAVNYLLFDVFSKKSIQAAACLQLVYFASMILKRIFSTSNLCIIHILAWVFQLIGHKIYEKNTPAFLENLYESFLFAPYFIFLEIFYADSFASPDASYKIIRELSTSENAKTIIYFAGLFQKAELQFKQISEQLPEYNHIFITLRFTKNDIFKTMLEKIATELENDDIHCIVGYSFGGSLAKQFKHAYSNKTGKDDVKTILISPGGFSCNTLLSNAIQKISPYFYSVYKNDKWYMINEYPVYQNVAKENNSDIFILSKDDYVHYPSVDTEKKIVLKNVLHENMVKVVCKQKIITQLLTADYDTTKVTTKPLSSNLSKFIFGSHFYPYHVGLWTFVSGYYTHVFLKNHYSVVSLLIGFLFSSTVWTFTEYAFHRFLLHEFFYHHHKKHHDFPNKKSIIHTPMFLVIANWFLYMSVFQRVLSYPLQISYYIFFPLNFLAFEYIHLLSHSYTGNNAIILNAKKYHKQHHYTANTNYSFVTPFWDYWFKTLNSEYSVSNAELLLGFLPFYSFMIHPCDTKKE